MLYLRRQCSIISEDSLQVGVSSMSLEGHLSSFLEGIGKEQMNCLTVCLPSLQGRSVTLM